MINWITRSPYDLAQASHPEPLSCRRDASTRLGASYLCNHPFARSGSPDHAQIVSLHSSARLQRRSNFEDNRSRLYQSTRHQSIDLSRGSLLQYSRSLFQYSRSLFFHCSCLFNFVFMFQRTSFISIWSLPDIDKSINRSQKQRPALRRQDN